MKQVIKSVRRAIEILELFQRRQVPLSASEICAELGYPNSSGNALLRSLVQLSYLTLDTNNMRYFPSMKLTQIGEWIPSQLLSERILLTMDKVSLETRETVCLSMQCDLQMQFVRALRGKHSSSVIAYAGYQFPVIGTVVGVALLATQDPPRVESLIARAKSDPVHTPTRDEIARTRQLIDECRSSGVAVAYDWYIPDAGTIAFPVPFLLGERTAILSVAGLASRIRKHEKNIIRTIRQAFLRAESIKL